MSSEASISNGRSVVSRFFSTSNGQKGGWDWNNNPCIQTLARFVIIRYALCPTSEGYIRRQDCLCICRPCKKKKNLVPQLHVHSKNGRFIIICYKPQINQINQINQNGWFILLRNLWWFGGYPQPLRNHEIPTPPQLRQLTRRPVWLPGVASSSAWGRERSKPNFSRPPRSTTICACRNTRGVARVKAVATSCWATFTTGCPW